MSHNTGIQAGGFLLVVAGFFIAMLDSTIVNVTLPLIGKDLDLSVGGLQWVVNAYTLFLAVLLPTMGPLCDRWGANRVYGVGLALFGLASTGCALAPNFALLLSARVMQGLAGACLIPSSLVLVSNLYHDRPARAKAIGGWGAAGGVAAATGPVLGGLMSVSFGWRAVFWVNVPLCFLLCMCLLPLTHSEIHIRANCAVNTTAVSPRFDWLGQILCVAAMGGASYAIIRIGTSGFDLIVFNATMVAFVSGVGFVMQERRVASPVVDMRLFASSTFRTSCFVGFMLNFALFGELFIVSLYLQQNLGLVASVAAGIIFPQMCSAIIAAPLGGRAVAKWGTNPVMLSGLVIGACGFVAMNAFTHIDALPLLGMVSFVASFGMAFAMPAASAAAVEAVPVNKRGLASGAINTARQFGTVVGTAVLGSLFAALPQDYGIHAGLLCAAAAFSVGAFFVLRRVPSSTK